MKYAIFSDNKITGGVKYIEIKTFLQLKYKTLTIWSKQSTFINNT